MAKITLNYVNIFCILLVAEVCSGQSVKRPRGVALEMAALYPPEESFTCFDGSLTIPFAYVNDDYCDCLMDGSDEPGTAACPNGTYHCKNIGHVSWDIPSSRVNDDVCDCCDRSDEYDSDVVCENTCSVLGQAAREHAAKVAMMYREGSKLREVLCTKGDELRKDKEERLKLLSKDEEILQKQKDEKEATKNQVEVLEKAALDAYRIVQEEMRERKERELKIQDERTAKEAFLDLNLDGDEKVTIPELQENLMFDLDNDGIVTEEEAQVIFGTESAYDMDTFVEYPWTQIKQLKNKSLFNPPSQNQEKTSELSEDKSESEMDELDLHEGQDEDDNDDDQEADFPKKDIKYDEDDEEVHVPSATTDTIEEYDPETKKLIDEANGAREEFEKVDRDLRDVQREVNQIRTFLDRHHGDNKEFAYMDGECYEYTDREYIYKLCPFDNVSQRSKNGGSETRLGTWSEWIGGKTESMLYTGGQTCWNGPQRKTEVKLLCGLETSIISASEPSRCEYLIQLRTPAVCVLHGVSSEDKHDEL